MGLMRFLVHDPSRIDRQALDRVCLVGQEDLPYVGRTYLNGDQLVVERRDDASASLWAPWTLPDHGQLLLASCALMERPRPYLLEVELARGSLFRVRNQLAMWEQLGLKPTQALQEQISHATKAFARAATNQHKHAEAARAADESLSLSTDAGVLLASTYAEQAINVRKTATPKLPTLIGVRLGTSTPAGADAKTLTNACSMIAVPAAWKTIEASEGKRRWKSTDDQVTWAHKQEMRIACGPLLEFDEACVPEWAYLWEGDFDAIATFMLAHVKAVVSRYRGRVQLWNVASRINRTGVLSLTDEQRLQLAARAVRTAREIDPKTPIIAGFDQPWGGYMASQESDLGPIDFADALERADLGISGFGVEINVGYSPSGAANRGPLDLSRLLDQWSLRLDLPLLVSVTAPSSSLKDNQANPRVQVVAGGAANDTTTSSPAPSTPLKSSDEDVLDEDETSAQHDSASDTMAFMAAEPPKQEQKPVGAEFQTRWAEQNLPILLAKNCVQVVLWNQHRDDEPHQYPHGGLVDTAGKPKPTLGFIEKLRKDHLV